MERVKTFATTSRQSMNQHRKKATVTELVKKLRDLIKASLSKIATFVGRIRNSAKALPGKIKKLGVKILGWITKARVIALGYVVLIVAVSYLLPKSNTNISFLAPRFLGKNTRLGQSLLIVPRNISFEERSWLTRERGKLEGRYLVHDIAEGSAITSDAVISWPQLNPEEGVPFELDAEPDWMILNQGTTVQVWLGGNAEPERAQLLAIVPYGNKWMALLRKSDLKQTSLGPPNVTKTARIEVLPLKSAADQSVKSPATTSRESPADPQATKSPTTAKKKHPPKSTKKKGVGINGKTDVERNKKNQSGLLPGSGQIILHRKRWKSISYYRIFKNYSAR